MWRLGRWVNRSHLCGLVLLLFISVHFKEVTSIRCEVGRELDSQHQWKWVFPYPDLCECTSIVMGGRNTWPPKRTYQPVYIIHDIKEIKEHFYLVCMSNHPDTDVSDHAAITSSTASSMTVTHDSLTTMEDNGTMIPSSSASSTAPGVLTDVSDHAAITSSAAASSIIPDSLATTADTMTPSSASSSRTVDTTASSTEVSHTGEHIGTSTEALRRTTRIDETFTSDESGASWQYTNNWGDCSVTCGPGRQSRTQVCLSADGTTADNLCTGDPATEERTCTSQACPSWEYMEDWSGCSETCGGGTQHRTQKCIDAAGQSADGLCTGDPATEQRSCEEDDCKEGGCFASDSIVYVKVNTPNGTLIQRKRLDQLKVGDYVESFEPETNSITFSQVYFITHDKEIMNSFTLLKLVIGYEGEREISLRLHPKHLVYACQQSRYSKQPVTCSRPSLTTVTCSRPSLTPVEAETVQPGDMLWLRNSTNDLSPTPVLYIETTKSGIRHPMTFNHYIVVDGILASVHMYDEGLYRHATAPLRFVFGINPIVTDTWLIKKFVQMWDVVETNIL